MTDWGALEADAFGRRYRQRDPWAVHGVSLRIPPGSITALVGPNGAGKSTLIRAWLGFERPDAGRVLVGGIDPQHDRAAAIREVGYVPQASALHASLSIEDHFTFVRSYRSGFNLDRARARIDSLGLDRRRRIATLSGGEKAQVALAVALALGTRVLVLDEPMASLDPLARREFLSTLVADARTSGATVVMSSHIVTDIEEACDSVVVLSHGRLLIHDGIAAVRATHVVADASTVDPLEAVGVFTGRTGERVALVKGTDQGRKATLEEVVLGYLATPGHGARAGSAA